MSDIFDLLDDLENARPPEPRRVEHKRMVPAEEWEAMKAENARLTAELAALKARRCETCKHWCWGSTPTTCWLDGDLGGQEPVWHAEDGCSRWQPKEAPDA